MTSGEDGNRPEKTQAHKQAAGVPTGERLLDEDQPPADDEQTAEIQSQQVLIDDPDTPPLIDKLGELGIYLSYVAVVLAVLGVGLAKFRIQPLGNVTMFFSLVLVSVAMLVAATFQAYASDISLPTS